MNRGSNGSMDDDWIGTPMNPSKVRRKTTVRLTDLPNVGPAMARDLERLGIRTPADLRGRDPLDLYEMLCAATRVRQDPCVLERAQGLPRRCRRRGVPPRGPRRSPDLPWSGIT